MSLIQLTNLTKTYKTGDVSVVAVNHVNLTIESGALVAVMGESGCGKSTLLNLIGLLDTPDEGEYLLENQNVATLSDNELSIIRNQKIGFVFQSFCLLPKLTIIHNVALPLLYRGLSVTQAQTKAYAMLEKVGIAKLAERKPNELSGGQQQRVAIARALVGNPKVLLADEPTGALDSTTSQEIVDIFVKLQQEQQCTVIIITHSPNIGEQCHQIITMQDGKIIKSEDKL